MRGEKYHAVDMPDGDRQNDARGFLGTVLSIDDERAAVMLSTWRNTLVANTFRCGLFAMLVAVVPLDVLAQPAEVAPPERDTRPAERPPEPTQDPMTRALEEALAELDASLPPGPSHVNHRRAELLFRLGRYAEAVKEYDLAATVGRPHDEYSCWERGLAQYYAGDYHAGAEQFARYHEVGALDIENGLWRFMCIAEDEGIEKARAAMFDYPRKVRLPFPALLELYMGRGTADAVFEEAENGEIAEAERTERRFYAHYYVGKYFQTTGEQGRAREEVTAALKYEIPHFMYACAEADARILKSASE